MSQCGLPPDLQTPQQYKTDSTNMVGEAQIVRLEAGSRSSVPRKLALNTEILRKVAFDANDYPLAVIAIAGPSQSDNSFMLTCVVRYLQALERAGDRNVGDWMHKNKPDIITKDEGFEFRNRVDQTAEGIWMWTRPFIIKRFETESPIAVVVMATQGCFDPRTNEQDQFSIIGLSLLLSSCFIYNDTRLINENTVSTLTQFMHYGQVASQPFEGKAFQRLLFLIRNCNASGFNHGAVFGSIYLEITLFKRVITNEL
ncbi:unnamed protein product [Allacma fusca]|uniref:Guanylate-binding protein N-terminal domain-containing protein n=1 Tax=Allacma fusca TaxID=39272 RepID=A0A8J2L9K0_9HEXA|nr:unnamed protein product [Allacma fusca]